MIEIKQFSKSYGNKIAVQPMNLTIESGSICGFIGHNGAGKTTTLKAIVGILPFQSGEIFICGHSIQKDTIKAKQKLAYVPDNPDIYEFMTGIDYINFICNAYAVPQAMRERNLEKYATEFEIKDVLNDGIGSYSHGMKQKVVLTSALIHQPEVLILDEPFVGLDPKASSVLKNAMIERCAEGGCILYSTHVLEVAENLCHTLAMIKDGKLLLHKKTEDILQNGSLEQTFFHYYQEEEPCSD